MFMEYDYVKLYSATYVTGDTKHELKQPATTGLWR